MISHELSTIQQKDVDRAWIAQAVAEFESRGESPSPIPADKRSIDIDTFFNGRSRDGKNIGVRPSRESQIAAQAASMTLAEAMQIFHLSGKYLTGLAEAMGFKFKRGYTTNQEYRSADASAVERITALRDVGLNRAQVMKQIGMSYDKFHRLLTDYKIEFPVVPRRLRNKRVKS